MPRPSVAIRLGTEGGETVRRDFAAIGDAGDAQAKRLTTAFDRAGADMEAAMRRQAMAAAKIAAISPQSSQQMRVNDAVGTGFGQYEGSAKASAMAFRELIAEQERYEAAAARIRAVLDPTSAAQDRFNAEMAEARTLVSAGTLTLDEYCDKLRLEQAALMASSTAHGRTNASVGQLRAGTQQLYYQIGDVTEQFAMGTPPMVIFAQQAGQTVQAIQMMTNTSKGFLGFLAGPWGAVLIGGVSILAALTGNLWKSKDAAEGAASGNEEHKTSTERLGDALNKLDEAMGRHKRSAAQMRIDAVDNARAMYFQEVATLNAAKALLILAQAQAQKDAERAVGGRSANYGGQYISQNSANRVSELTNQISTLEGSIDGAERRLQMNLDRHYKLTGEEAAAASAKSAAELKRIQDRASAEAERLQRERESLRKALQTDYEGLEKQFDPLNAKIREYTEALAKLAKVRDGGLITGAKADEWAMMLSAQRLGEVDGINIGSLREDASKEETAAKNRGDFIRQIVEDQAEQDAILSRQLDLAHATGAEEESQIERLRLIIDLRKAGLDIEGSDAQAILKANDALAAKTQVLQRIRDSWQEVRQFGEGFIDTVLSPNTWSSWGNAGKTILNEIRNEFLKLAVINPLKNAMFGGGLPTLGSIGKLFGGGAAVGNNAVGTEYWTGGMTWVAENGPEKIELPRGSKVSSARDTRSMADQRATGDTHVNVYASDAVLTDTVLGWIQQGMAVASTQGAIGGSQGAQRAMSRRRDRSLA